MHESIPFSPNILGGLLRTEADVSVQGETDLLASLQVNEVQRTPPIAYVSA